MIWTVCFGSLVAMFLVLALKTTPQLALGVVNVIGCTLPAWLIVPLFDVPADTVVGSGLDIKVAVATTTLMLYCFLPGRTFPLRFVPCDYAMLALAIIHLVSDAFNSGFRWTDLFRAYAEWYVPYVAGRVAFQRFEDSIRLTHLLAAMALVLGGVAIIEAFTRTNPMELWAGLRPVEGAYRALSRWGMKRSYGPYFHPLYFGVVQGIFLGASLCVALRALRKQARSVWLFCPIFSIVGMICTGSRGPILGGCLLMLTVFIAMLPRVRMPMAVLVICLLTIGLVKREALLQTLETWSGESNDRLNQTVEVGGRRQKYSGTRGRLLALRVYSKAVKQGGLIGFGTDRVTGFPIKVPLSGEAAELIKTMETVENSYLLVALRFGWLGLLAFVCAIGCSLFQWWRLTLYAEHQQKTFGLVPVGSRASRPPGQHPYPEDQQIGLVPFGSRASRPPGQRPYAEDQQFGLVTLCLGSATWATAVVLLTVWMPHDIGFPFLWMMGASSGLYLTRQSNA